MSEGAGGEAASASRVHSASVAVSLPSMVSPCADAWARTSASVASAGASTSRDAASTCTSVTAAGAGASIISPSSSGPPAIA